MLLTTTAILRLYLSRNFIVQHVYAKQRFSQIYAQRRKKCSAKNAVARNQRYNQVLIHSSILPMTCQTTVHIHTESTEEQVISILNVLIKHPDLIHVQDDPYHNDKVGTLQEQLDTVMLCQPIDEATAIKLIYEIAAEQYNQIDDSAYETERLHRLMLRFKPADELNAELLAKSIDRILVYKNSIQVILKNGQTISSEEVI